MSYVNDCCPGRKILGPLATLREIRYENDVGQQP